MPRLRILSWNLWHALDPYGKVLMRPIESRSERVARQSRQTEIMKAWRKSAGDVLCLQELNPVRKRGRVFESALDCHGATSVVNAGLKIGALGLPPFLREGLGIFAANGFSNPRFRELTLSGEGWEWRIPLGGDVVFQLAERRKALILEAVFEGLKICIVDLHLHHGPDTSLSNQQRRMSEVEKLCGELGVRDGASTTHDLILIAGDFNCEVDSPSVKGLIECGFLDAAERSGATVVPPTWDPTSNRLAAISSELTRDEEAKLWDASPHVFDRIYVKAGFPVSVRYAQIREPGLSDHFAVSAEIEW